MRSLQRRCERVAEPVWRGPFTFEELLGAIERRRGRPLKVVEGHLGTLPEHAVWSRTDGRRRMAGQELDDENVGP